MDTELEPARAEALSFQIVDEVGVTHNSQVVLPDRNWHLDIYVSPSERWAAAIGEEIRLVRSDGYEVDVEPLWLRWRTGLEEQLPVWSPDSSAFAFLGD